MSSTIAEIAFALSIPASIAIFFVMRPVRAALLVAFGTEMFLPEGTHYKFPFMPAFDKHNLPYLCILIACLPRVSISLPAANWRQILSPTTFIFRMAMPPLRVSWCAR